MSVQWNLIAGFLYTEIVVVLLLILPIMSPRRWNKFFQSNFVKMIASQAYWYFYLMLLTLAIFLADSVREMRKYSNIDMKDHIHSHLDAEMQANMRLFRAQRNFYICGFSLFLVLVIKRLLSLISNQAQLIAQSEAALKQAQSASSVAKKIMAQGTINESEQNEANEAHDRKVTELKEKLNELQEKLDKEVSDKKAIKSQAESVTKEYDRLLKEFTKLQEAGGAGDKKHE